MDTIHIADWFDPHNEAHLRAYRHLEDTGAWPEGFIPDHVGLPGGWHIGVVSKMGLAWLNEKIPKENG